MAKFQRKRFYRKGRLSVIPRGYAPNARWLSRAPQSWNINNTLYRTSLGLRAIPQGGSFGQASPFKPKMFVRHKYCELSTLTAGTAGIMGTEIIYRLNDLYDPYFSGGGHQPYGRDTMAGIYNRYKVSGCKIDLTFTDPSADGMAVACAIQDSTESATLTNLQVDEAQEKQNCIVKFLNNTGAQKVNIKKYMPIHMVEGLTKLQFKADIENYSANASNSPVSTPFVRIAIGNVTGTTGGTVHCMVKLTFYSQWYNRLQLSQS